MGRPRIEDDPVFAEGFEKWAALEGAVDRAKAEAMRIVEHTKRRVSQERMKIIRDMKERGLSNYGISRITGVTSHYALTELVRRALEGSDEYGGFSTKELRNKGGK